LNLGKRRKMDGAAPVPLELWILILAVILIILLRSIRKKRVKIVRKIPLKEYLPSFVPSFRVFIEWFLGIMGIIIIFYSLYIIGKYVQIGFDFSKLSPEGFINLLLPFSVGLTEIVVAWLLSSTEKEDHI
jgi:hypothetical protein